MIKVGSKRRRTAAEIRDAYTAQQFDDIDARDTKVKYTEAEKKIADLEA